MRVRDTAARRAALGLAVAALAAGLAGGLWETPLRAGVSALVSHTPAGQTSPAATSQAARPSAAAPAPAPSPASDAQAAVAAAMAGLAAGRPPGSISVAALDTATGTRLAWGETSGMTAASVFKLLLLEGYLLQDQDRGLAPGDDRGAALTAMVENSDNDAADEVYAALGGRPGVASMLHRLGLSATVLDPQDQWGLSTTSAADLLTALTALVSPQSPLSAASRAYALQLLSDVEPDQRWGVGAAGDPGAGFANKNGWLDVDTDGGRWVVSSVGVVQVGGHQVLMAVLTQHDSDLADGTRLVESASQAVATALRAADAAAAGTPG